MVWSLLWNFLKWFFLEFHILNSNCPLKNHSFNFGNSQLNYLFNWLPNKNLKIKRLQNYFKNSQKNSQIMFQICDFNQKIQRNETR